MSSKIIHRKIDQACNNHNQKITLIKSDLKDVDLHYLTQKIDVQDGVQLRLYKNLITAKGVQILKNSKINLRFLSISNNLIGDKGCKYLAKADWPLLRVLYMKQNQISDCGLRYLMRGSWSNLKQLGISKNTFGPEGSISLTKGNWKITQLQFKSQNQSQVYSISMFVLCDWNLEFVATNNSKDEIEIVKEKHPKVIESIQ